MKGVILSYDAACFHICGIFFCKIDIGLPLPQGPFCYALIVVENSELINEAVATFDQIFNNIQSTSDILREMIDGVSKVDEVAANVAAISEEQAASADEILATSQDMVEQAQSITQSSQDVADNSHELANTSQTLTDYVRRFKIDKYDSESEVM